MEFDADDFPEGFDGGGNWDGVVFHCRRFGIKGLGRIGASGRYDEVLNEAEIRTARLKQNERQKKWVKSKSGDAAYKAKRRAYAAAAYARAKADAAKLERRRATVRECMRRYLAKKREGKK